MLGHQILTSIESLFDFLVSSWEITKIKIRYILNRAVYLSKGTNDRVGIQIFDLEIQVLRSQYTVCLDRHVRTALLCTTEKSKSILGTHV